MRNGTDHSRQRSTRQVLEDHLRHRYEREVEEDIARNYAKDVVLLTALILEKTAEPDRPAMLRQLTHGATYHRAEVLLDRLRERGIALTVELAKRMRRFDWTTDLRYETGRKDTGETNALHRSARAIYDWVEEQIT